MYAYGQGVSKNLKEAVKWIRLAAEQGNALAQFNLGISYKNGQGIPWSIVEAFKWIRLAAEQGFAEAQYTLGLMYYRGEGTPWDYKEAYAWLSVSAANGFEDAVSWSDRIAKRNLTPEQLAQAQLLTKQYFEKYQPKP